MSSEPAAPVEIKRQGYQSGLLDSLSRNECKTCHKWVSPSKAWFCPKCGFLACGDAECDPEKSAIVKQIHVDHICEQGAFSQASNLVYSLLRPFKPQDPDHPEKGGDTVANDFLLDACILWAISARTKLPSADIQQRFYDRMRLPHQWLEVAMARPEGAGDEFVTSAHAGMALRARLNHAFLGEESFMVVLFGAHLLAIQPDYDTFAQVLYVYGALADTRLQCFMALTDHATEEAIEMNKMLEPYRLLECFVDSKGMYTCTTGVRKADNKDFVKQLFNQDFEKQVVKGRPINVLWLIDLIHTQKDEANAKMMTGDYKPTPELDEKTGKQNMDPKTGLPCFKKDPTPRPASTQLLLRIMGTEDDPIVFVVQMHTTLYTVDHWLQGTLYTDTDKKFAQDNHSSTTKSAFSSMGPYKEPEVSLASQHKKFLVHHPPFGGSKVRQLSGRLELNALADNIALLCEQGTKTKARVKAYEEVTGVKWPFDLSPFIALLVRANLVA